MNIARMILQMGHRKNSMSSREERLIHMIETGRFPGRYVLHEIKWTCLGIPANLFRR
jgi:hypothetical protein